MGVWPMNGLERYAWTDTACEGQKCTVIACQERYKIWRNTHACLTARSDMASGTAATSARYQVYTANKYTLGLGAWMACIRSEKRDIKEINKY